MSYDYACTHCGITNTFNTAFGIITKVNCWSCCEEFLITPLREEPRIKMESEPKKHGSKIFYKLLEEMANLHDVKSHDYADDNDPFGNYKFAGHLASLFDHSPDDMGFVGRLGEKIFRLAVLEGNKLSPKNESIEETENDLCVIMCLWVTMRREKRFGGVRSVFTTPTTVMTTIYPPK